MTQAVRADNGTRSYLDDYAEWLESDSSSMWEGAWNKGESLLFAYFAEQNATGQRIRATRTQRTRKLYGALVELAGAYELAGTYEPHVARTSPASGSASVSAPIVAVIEQIESLFVEPRAEPIAPPTVTIGTSLSSEFDAKVDTMIAAQQADDEADPIDEATIEAVYDVAMLVAEVAGEPTIGAAVDGTVLMQWAHADGRVVDVYIEGGWPEYAMVSSADGTVEVALPGLFALNSVLQGFAH